MSWLNGSNVAVIIFFIGLAGLILRKDMMISVLSIGIMNAAIVLFLVTMNATVDSQAPMTATSIATAADPVPQALMITSVVIGVSVTAVFLVLVLNYYREHRTLDWQAAKLLSLGQRNPDVAPGPVQPLDIPRIVSKWWAQLR